MKRMMKALGAFALTLVMTLLVAVGPTLAAEAPADSQVSSSGYLVVLQEEQRPSLYSVDPMAQAALFAASDEREELLPLAQGMGIYKAADLDEIQNLVYTGQVQLVEPDYEAELLDMVTTPTEPNDPYFTSTAAYQFNLKDSHGIRVRAAWDAGLTGEGVTIAVIDSGMNLNHVDAPVKMASGRYYYYREEAGGRWKFTIDGKTKEYGYYSTDYVMDNVGHGTMVTGIIAAATDNDRAIAGIAPNATIIPVRCFTNTAGHLGGYTSNLISGINYAVENGADIINMSWGVRADSGALKNAIINASNAGCILIAAVGNDGNSSLQYPAAYDNVIGVGSTDRNGYLSDFSQRNDSVTLCAPGGSRSSKQIYSLGYSSTTAIAKGDGTSFAAPAVTAAAALLKEADPAMTQADFLALLQGNCDPVLFHDGDDPAHAGLGLLDLKKLLDAAGHSGLRFRSDADGITVRAAYHPVQSPTQAADPSAMVLIGAYNAAGHLLDSRVASAALDPTYGSYSLTAVFPAQGVASIQAFYLKKDSTLSALADPARVTVQ